VVAEGIAGSAGGSGGSSAIEVGGVPVVVLTGTTMGTVGSALGVRLRRPT
jgi:hypothetical protein